MPPAAWDAGALAAGWDEPAEGDAPPPEQAETTIAAIANGVASRRSDCFLVKSVLL
jgi:hypothetical protein